MSVGTAVDADEDVRVEIRRGVRRCRQCHGIGCSVEVDKDRGICLRDAVTRQTGDRRGRQRRRCNAGAIAAGTELSVMATAMARSLEWMP
jgi:hypothetical protein